MQVSCPARLSTSQVVHAPNPGFVDSSTLEGSAKEVEVPPIGDVGDQPDRRLDEVKKLVPTHKNRAYDMKRLIRSIVDTGSFTEVKPDFGAALITGLTRLHGWVVGIVASQPLVRAGAYGTAECDKATSFLCVCDSYHIPLVFLHDVPGFRVGSVAEVEKMATKIMVWNQALAWTTVPKFSVVISKSIGAAYSNMCGPNMGVDFVVAWPTAEISFTGPEVGVNVVYGRRLAQSPNLAEERAQLLEGWEFDSAPYRATAKHLLTTSLILETPGGFSVAHWMWLVTKTTARVNVCSQIDRPVFRKGKSGHASMAGSGAWGTTRCVETGGSSETRCHGRSGSDSRRGSGCQFPGHSRVSGQVSGKTASAIYAGGGNCGRGRRRWGRWLASPRSASGSDVSTAKRWVRGVCLGF